MKGLVVSLVLLAALVAIGRLVGGDQAPAAPTPPAQEAELSGPLVAVNGIECIAHRTGTDMRGSLRNTSAETLQYVKVFATFDGQVFDGYINENTLQPGMASTFLLPGPSHQTSNCTLMYVQDRNGKRIN